VENSTLCFCFEVFVDFLYSMNVFIFQFKSAQVRCDIVPRARNKAIRDYCVCYFSPTTTGNKKVKLKISLWLTPSNAIFNARINTCVVIMFYCIRRKCWLGNKAACFYFDTTEKYSNKTFELTRANPAPTIAPSN
jgi:hypothetical protein